MRKKILFILFVCCTFCGFSQHKVDSRLASQGQLIVEAASDEQFVVMLNGRKQNKAPLSKVEIQNLADQEYLIEVQVVSAKFKRNKARMNIRLNAPTMRLKVMADRKSQTVTLSRVEESCGNNHSNCVGCPHHKSQMRQPAVKKDFKKTPDTRTFKQEKTKMTGVTMAPADFEGICRQLNEEKFSENKMLLAKELIVKYAPFYSEQIAKMGDMFSFDKDRLEFFRYAYRYCADPEHYRDLAKMLKFDSNQKELLNFIK